MVNRPAASANLKTYIVPAYLLCRCLHAGINSRRKARGQGIILIVHFPEPECICAMVEEVVVKDSDQRVRAARQSLGNVARGIALGDKVLRRRTQVANAMAVVAQGNVWVNSVTGRLATISTAPMAAVDYRDNRERWCDHKILISTQFRVIWPIHCV